MRSVWRLGGRRGFFLISLLYLGSVLFCAMSFIRSGDLTLGRHPLANFKRTLGEMIRPSAVDLWAGDPHFEYRDESGVVLRVEDRRVVERDFIWAVGRAAWTTLKIGTLGTLLAAVIALPLGAVTARNLRAPRILSILCKMLLDGSRAVHTLVFGLFYVAIVGLGPVAGILAVASHSLGSFGKLYAESIETLDPASIDGVRAVGASPAQVFFFSVWPSVIPQIVSTHLYIWEVNIRDSTVLGLVGAGGLGLLISEATSLFQWARLSTLLLVLVGMVSLFDMISRRIRTALL